MKREIHDSTDLEWLLRHTRAFRGGQMADVHIGRRHLFDENLNMEVLAGTTITLLIRYAVMDVSEGHGQRLQRWARLICSGVTDFSFFEQEGANSGAIEALQTEWKDGRLRFWFDQFGEVYIVCEEAELEEVSVPDGSVTREACHEWVFQAHTGVLPTIEWLLKELDRVGWPCAWRPDGLQNGVSSRFTWSGLLSLRVGAEEQERGTLSLRGYGALGEHSFGIVARVCSPHPDGAELLAHLAEVLTRHFSGDSVGMETVLPRIAREGRSGG